MRGLSFLVPLLISHSASSNRFHKAINHIKSAQDKAFHDALLQQLAASRINSTGVAVDSDPHIANVDLSLGPIVDAATNGTGGYADGSTSSFQIYTTDSLPTSPAPSSACAAALTASVACNSTVPLMRCDF
jgi:hypothetical protein